METAYQTHIGRVRQANEDSVQIQPLTNGWFSAVVADGMGGHQAGDVASRMAVEILMDRIGGLSTPISLSELEDKMDLAIQQANKEIFEFAQTHSECRGMGTTIVIAVVNEKSGVLAHIGDSRIYLGHQGQLEPMTNDHTLVNELLKNHQITPEEAISHPRRNILTRALGTDEIVEADFQILDWKTGDLLLLCSDGLYGKVTQEEMEKIIQQETPTAAAEQFIQQALAAGGDDNITVALLYNREEISQGEEGH